MDIMGRPEPANFMRSHVFIPIDKILGEQTGRHSAKTKAPIKNPVFPEPHHNSEADKAHQNIREELPKAHGHGGYRVFGDVSPSPFTARHKDPFNRDESDKGGRGKH